MNYKLLLIILLLGGVSVFFVYQIFGKQQTQIPTVTIEPSSVPTSTPGQTEEWKTYKNSKYGYAVDYPANWNLKEFPDTKTGAGFQPPDNQNGVITIDVLGMVLDDRGIIPFAEYVKTAARNEIQNYKSLASIKEVVTNSGLKGYETTWNVAGLTGGTYVSPPRTYFPLPQKYGTKTLQMTLDYSNYADVYHQMLTSVKYSE